MTDLLFQKYIDRGIYQALRGASLIAQTKNQVTVGERQNQLGNQVLLKISFLTQRVLDGFQWLNKEKPL